MLHIVLALALKVSATPTVVSILLAPKRATPSFLTAAIPTTIGEKQGRH